MITAWLAILLVLAALMGLLAALSIYRRRCHPDPELPRKLLHVGMGVICLSFPWLFEAVWPVLVLSGVSTAMLWALRSVPLLRHHIGGVIHGVQRSSSGDLWYPVSVALVFALAGRDPALYCAPIVLLALADPAAALVGRRGRLRYATRDGVKTLEGSTAFGCVGFLCIQVVLALLRPSYGPELILVSAAMGLLTAVVESYAWGGLDNLFVPLAGLAILAVLSSLPVAALYLLLAGAGTLVILVVAVSGRGVSSLPRPEKII
jgi:phytol kinase